MKYFTENISELSHREEKKILKGKKIWIDLDNSPHVPFFVPIMRELNNNGYSVVLTTRVCAQTCGLADLYGLKYECLGRHYGKNKFFKIAGTIYRALLLAKTIRKVKPCLAVSHGSRPLFIAAKLLRIPSLGILDYEHTKRLITPNWQMLPEIISLKAISCDQKHFIRYPGIKEDVYVPFFKPDEKIKKELGLREENINVAIRPPATEAHYHNAKSDILFNEVINYLGDIPNVRMVIVPRNEKQEEEIKRAWARWCSNGKILIPDRVVEGLNLLWYSDLVISGGGTMNREAAALGVPVFSIFRGKIGDVDRYLEKNNRLILIESIEDIRKKIKIQKADGHNKNTSVENNTLKFITGEIMRILETRV